jgi:hypothetical protein
MTEQQVESTAPRWVGPYGLSDLSIAVDEIYFLRAMLADEAAIIEAHLGYKTFPKTRRAVAEQQVDRMRRVANGEMWSATREKFDQGRALRTAEAPTTLTNSQWAEQRGLKFNPLSAPMACGCGHDWERHGPESGGCIECRCTRPATPTP